MSLAALLRVTLPTYDDGDDEEWFERLRADGPLKNPFDAPVTTSMRGVTWVTLSDELQLTPSNDLVARLGLLPRFVSVRSVAVSYTVPVDSLRIPTVLDAGCWQLFVPKAKGDSRAWNWRDRDWGLTELVHAIDAPITDVQLEAVHVPHEARFSTHLLDFRLNVAPAVETAVRAALRRCAASTELHNFIGGDADIAHLDHRAFELFLGVLYSIEGYETTVTRASRDGGIDVIAVSDNNRDEILLIQAKKTQGAIGIEVLRGLAGARYFADRPDWNRAVLVVATTGRFTEPTLLLEKQRPWEVNLQDYEKLTARAKRAKSVSVADIASDAVQFVRVRT
jgi:hypothetical protein